MKVLIVRFSSIGDIVLTTPVVRCLKNQTEAEIHYLTKQSFATILENNPNIDRLWTFKKSVNEVVDLLKAQHFDFVVDLHHNIRTFKLKFKLGVESKSFPKLNFEKWLYVNLKMQVMPHIHVVERYFEAVHSLDVVNDNMGLDYFIKVDEEVNIQERLPLQFHRGFVAFTLGAQFKTKCLPENKIIELIELIQLPIVFLGGKEDQKLGEILAQKYQNYTFNLAGLLSLGQSASVLKNAAVVIAYDTGLMHIASSFHVPIALVWGNTTPKIGMYPYLVKAPVKFFEVENLSCRPCSKIGYKKCPKKHFRCMQNQDLRSLASFVKTSFLNRTI